MKNNKITYKISLLIAMFLFSSCTEWGETLTYKITNNVNDTIIVIKKEGVYNIDTIKLNNYESIIDTSIEDSGNATPYPFFNYDTIIFIFKDSIKKIYQRELQGKNPLIIDYYDETSRNETKKRTTINYEYLIELSDFN